MYSIKRNVLETVALVKAFDIQDIVLCPGSRNAPFSLSFAADDSFRCHSVVDERSAAFFALGLIMATKRPVVVCCTSGTALLNFAPAVAEACYQNLPLIVISADRPPSWIGQMDGQTIQQQNVFRDLVRCSVHLPEFGSENDHWHANRLLNEALNACTEGSGGPVHLNVPISEPFSDYSVDRLPEVRVIRSWTAQKRSNDVLPDLASLGELSDALLQSKRVMLIVGQQLPINQTLSGILEELSDTYGVVVLSEYLSNLSGDAVIGSFDVILNINGDIPSPDLLITLGGHIVSKRLKQFIREKKPDRHFHLTLAEDMPDLYQSLTDVIRGNPVLILENVLESLHDIMRSNNYKNSKLDFIDLPYLDERKLKRKHYLDFWKELSSVMPGDGLKASRKVLEELPFSDLFVTGVFATSLPEKATVFVGNSSPVRNLQLFRLPNGCTVYCNRGTNGIEGTLSTACGFATVSEELVYVLMGDLSFFYDLNIIARKQVPSNLRILVINNGGGGIFQLISRGQHQEDHSRFVAASHQQEVSLWSLAAGLKTLKVGPECVDSKTDEIVFYSLEKTIEAMGEWIRTASEKAVVLEVITPGDNGKYANDIYLNFINLS
jgi:2-succinyl-5-enolpyruvyl-6-hydroxy-3-cyclohexene-1-carboxylate synthase